MPSSTTPTASTSKATATPKLASSSLLALKAEISRKTSTLTSNTPTYTRGSSNSSSLPSKPSQWQRHNRGIAQRQAQDDILWEQDVDDKGRSNNVRGNLERKARLYDLITKGKDSGLDRNKVSQLLVDFDAKDEHAELDGADEQESSSDQESDEQQEPMDDPRVGFAHRRIESSPFEHSHKLIQHTPTQDPMVEYQDEFGRHHRVPRSLVPPGIALPSNLVDAPPSNVYYGDQRHFPVYEPDPEKLAQIARETRQAKGPLVDRYDASKEKRTRGAGHLDLGRDEQTRKERLDSLMRIRDEAQVAREALQGVGGVQGKREMDKEERKRKLSEKREQVEASRKAKAEAGLKEE
ncbi:BQ2448_7462 [Microbotryum intermedium]|uniref:BQ2448_7462 protein n=1 Tax=Microbotryum intermedium TaxID=269621 RepID=A0A238FR20_9BASI|nr:BQ2448_7462 [Microbotryum intermedium]